MGEKITSMKGPEALRYIDAVTQSLSADVIKLREKAASDEKLLAMRKEVARGSLITKLYWINKENTDLFVSTDIPLKLREDVRLSKKINDDPFMDDEPLDRFELVARIYLGSGLTDLSDEGLKDLADRVLVQDEPLIDAVKPYEDEVPTLKIAAAMYQDLENLKIGEDHIAIPQIDLSMSEIAMYRGLEYAYDFTLA